MPAEPDRIIAIDPNLSSNDLDDAAIALGLTLVNALNHQLIYATADRASLVYVVEDVRAGTRFAILRGTGLDALGAALAGRFVRGTEP